MGEGHEEAQEGAVLIVVPHRASPRFKRVFEGSIDARQLPHVKDMRNPK